MNFLKLAHIGWPALLASMALSALGATSACSGSPAPPASAYAYAFVEPGTNDSGVCGESGAIYLALGSSTQPQPTAVADGASKAGGKASVSCSVDSSGGGYDIKLAATFTGPNGGSMFVSGHVDATSVNAETVFQAASISKHVAAMVALHLVDEGKLSLDEDVNLRLRSWKVPENQFTKTEKVTLRRLLNHSAGMTVHGFGGYAAGAPVPELLEVLDGKKPANSAPIRVDITPGTEWRYSGGGYEVMQQLVMDAAGKPFPQLAQEIVLGPLGMSHSTFEQPLPARFQGNAASAHLGSGAAIPGRWHTYPEMTAAGLWTTPSDLALVVRELQSGNVVLKPETRRQMLTKVLGNYGLGLGLEETDGHKSFSHGGSNAGFQCMMFAYLDRGRGGAVVMTNGDRGGPLAAEILRSIAAVYGWPDYKVTEE